MNKFLHGIVRRTCGRDTASGTNILQAMGGYTLISGSGNDFSGGLVVLRWRIQAECSNSEAANDSHYQPFLERRVA